MIQIWRARKQTKGLQITDVSEAFLKSSSIVFYDFHILSTTVSVLVGSENLNPFIFL